MSGGTRLDLAWLRDFNEVCDSPRLLSLALDRIAGWPEGQSLGDPSLPPAEALLRVLAADVDLALARRREIPAGPPVAPDPAPALMPVADGGREGPEEGIAPPAPVAGGAGTTESGTPGAVVGPEAGSAPGVPYTPSGADLSPAAAHLAGLPFDGAWTRADDLSLLKAAGAAAFGEWCEAHEREPREARQRLNLLTRGGTIGRLGLIAALGGVAA